MQWCPAERDNLVSRKGTRATCQAFLRLAFISAVGEVLELSNAWQALHAIEMLID